MAADPLQVQQDRSDLAITETDSGHRVDGTVSGGQVRFRDREDLFGFEPEWEARGAALIDTVALIVTYEFASQKVEVAPVCEMRVARMMSAAA